MYDFSKSESDFLKRFGETSNGKELLALLERIKSKTDRASSIPAGADYGAQVEGRRLVNTLFTDIINHMNKKERNRSDREVGIDEFN